MSHSKVFDFVREKGSILAATTKSGDSPSWFELVEIRKAWMVEHIKELGNIKLGNVGHGGPLGFWATIRQDLLRGHLERADRELTLDARGIFLFDPTTYGEYASDRDRVSMLVYGFDREGTWIYAWIGLTLSGSAVLDKKVTLSKTSPRSLWQNLQVSPKHIFKELGKVIERHSQRRAELADSAQSMWSDVQSENRLLGINQ